MGAKRESIDGAVIEGGDEFAANSMTRIASGFVHDDWNVGLAETEGEAESGQTAADDFHETRGARTHGDVCRRWAIIR